MKRPPRREVDRDPNVRELLSKLDYYCRFHLIPYGYWTELDGSYVIFDRKYRVLCRVVDGVSTVLPSDTYIDYVEQTWLYRNDESHPLFSQEMVYKLVRIVDRNGLREATKRRIPIERELRRWYSEAKQPSRARPTVDL
jgi:hypothetical protein